MPTVVIDASTLAAVMFSERRAEEVAALIDGKDLVAPALIRHEIISVALKKQRARPDDHHIVSDGLRSFMAFRIREDSVVALPVLELALQIDLSAYDASYLWLARRLRLPLITLDQSLPDAV